MSQRQIERIAATRTATGDFAFVNAPTQGYIVMAHVDLGTATSASITVDVSDANGNDIDVTGGSFTGISADTLLRIVDLGGGVPFSGALSANMSAIGGSGTVGLTLWIDRGD